MDYETCHWCGSLPDDPVRIAFAGLTFCCEECKDAWDRENAQVAPTDTQRL